MTSGENVVTAADVARLTGVQRPVVSMWRSRYASSATPFPAPIDAGARVLLFRKCDVEEWLRSTGREPDDVREWDADRVVRESLDEPSSWTDALLAVYACVACGADLDELHAFDGALRFAESLDPDETHLLPIILASRDVWQGAVRAVRQADVQPAEFVSALSASLPPLKSVAEWISGVTLALTEAPEDTGVALEAVGHGKVAWIVGAELSRRGLSVCSAGLGNAQQRRLAVWLMACAGQGTDATFPVGVVISDVTGATEPDIGEALTQHEQESAATRLVVGAASVLCGPGSESGVSSSVGAAVRGGAVEASVRLPAGLLRDAPRVELGLWVTTPSPTDGHRQQRVWGHSVRQDAVTWDGGQSVGDDLCELRRQRDSSGGVRLRSVRDWRGVNRVHAAAGTVALAPGVPHVFDVTSLSSMERAAEALRAGVTGVPVFAVATSTDDVPGGKTMTLGSLVDSEAAHIIPGVRVPSTAFTVGERFEVWESNTLTSGELRTVRAVDLPQGVGSERETRPGDVVFVSGQRPAAVVDDVGGRVPRFPCRVLRLADHAQVSAYAVADALGQAKGSRVAWKSVRVWVPPPERTADVAGLAQQLTRVAAQARTLARSAEAALETVVRQRSPGQAGITLDAEGRMPSSPYSSHQSHQVMKGAYDATS